MTNNLMLTVAPVCGITLQIFRRCCTFLQ